MASSNGSNKSLSSDFTRLNATRGDDVPDSYTGNDIDVTTDGEIVTNNVNGTCSYPVNPPNIYTERSLDRYSLSYDTSSTTTRLQDWSNYHQSAHKNNLYQLQHGEHQQNKNRQKSLKQQKIQNQQVTENNRLHEQFQRGHLNKRSQPSATTPPLQQRQHLYQRSQQLTTTPLQQQIHRERQYRDSTTGSITDNISLFLSESKYPQFSKENDRLSTYVNWLPNLKSPEIMSKAGLYSIKNGDYVRCFHCGIGLRHWDAEDDPWVEHARWSSNCEFILRVRGKEFVNLVQAAVRQAEIEETLAQNSRLKEQLPNDVESDGDNSPTAISGEKQRSELSPTERRNPLLTNAAQSVLQMGYLPKVVKKAVDEVLLNKGWIGLTGQNIMEVILEAESKNDIQKQRDYTGKWCEDQTKGAQHKIQSDRAKDVTTLKEENEELKERTTCKICCENNVSIVFLPCGHLVCCGQCAPALTNCPVCRTRVKGTVRVNLS